jgi:proliferating cell nuclear antigen
MNIIINSPQKAECFAFLFQHIKMFTEHINMMFEKERLYIQAMDNSRVSILEINIPKDWFDAYEIAASVTIGVNANILFRVLNAREKTQIIKMEHKNETNDKLNIHFTSDNKEEFDKHFEISLISIDSETMDIPEIEYQAEFTIGSANFANIINQLKTFGDSLEINCSEEKIMLTSSSIDQGKMSCEIKMDDLSSYAIEEGESIKSGFSLNYLHNICLYNKLSKEIDIKISGDYPMKIVYHIVGSETAKMTFFLAPKISDDD